MPTVPHNSTSNQQRVLDAATNPEGTALVANYDINWQEVDLDVKDRIDLSEIIERAITDITTALGMPSSVWVVKTPMVLPL